MISVGAFPLPDDVTNLAFNPRVGDGFIRVNAVGDEYASPNALSAYRRLGLIGDLVDENLAEPDRRAVPGRTRTGRRLGGLGPQRLQRPAYRAGLR